MRISDWSSDVCSSDLQVTRDRREQRHRQAEAQPLQRRRALVREPLRVDPGHREADQHVRQHHPVRVVAAVVVAAEHRTERGVVGREQQPVHDESEQQRGGRHDQSADPEALVHGVLPRNLCIARRAPMFAAMLLRTVHCVDEIGRAHVCTPVTNAHPVCRLLLEKKKSSSKNTSTEQKIQSPFCTIKKTSIIQISLHSLQLTLHNPTNHHTLHHSHSYITYHTLERDLMIYTDSLHTSTHLV